jgi:hypothetical protein
MNAIMRPEIRSIVIAILAGMMAAAYLDNAGRVDLSFGFPDGGPVEGTFIALIGAVGGFVVLMSFRGVRKLFQRARQ